MRAAPPVLVAASPRQMPLPCERQGFPCPTLRNVHPTSVSEEVKHFPEKSGADAEGGNPRTGPGQMTPEGHFTKPSDWRRLWCLSRTDSLYFQQALQRGYPLRAR